MRLTDWGGEAEFQGTYSTRYCCTWPVAGSQRTLRLLGEGLNT